MSLPSSVGLPAEMMLGNLDFSIPPDAKSFSAKIQPSNINSVTASFTPATTQNTAFPDQPFPSQNIIFDIPCGQSPSTFLDNRFSTINFTMTVSTPTLNGGDGTGKFTDAYLRSSAASWFDRMYILGQNGSQLEDISEFGLLNDTMISLQMNNSVRHGMATQYGFDVNASAIASQGHKIDCISSGVGVPAATLIQSNSYSFPLMSGIIGCLSDKMCNVGRTSRMQLVLMTTSTIPISGGVGTAFTASPTITVTLSNFSLQLEYIDIGINALQMLDQTLVDNKAYIHGTTFRTSSTSIAAAAGSQTALIGVRASSVKSIFARFSQGGTASATNSLSGKYDSINPCISTIGFQIGGIRYPQAPIPVLYSPAQAFRETQCAIGSFNNSAYQSCIIPSAYCSLAAGATIVSSGTLANNNKGATQDFNWNRGTVVNALAQFIFGENLEICAKRSLLSGLNCTSAPIFCEMNLAGAPANICTMYAQVWCDHILVHDTKTGDISIRI